MLVPAFWEALMLGCDDEALGFCLEAAFGHLWVLSLSTPAGQQGPFARRHFSRKSSGHPCGRAG